MTGVVGILLAGGRGERLGLGRPKALAVLGGATLLERAAATLRRVCSEVMVVAPAEVVLPLPEGARRLLDPGAGPLGGLAVAGSALECERALVLGVDFPLASAALLEALAERLGARRAVVPAPGGRPQPLVAAYSGEGLAGLAGAFARGERAVTRAIAGLGPRLLDDAELAGLPGGAEGCFDVDTPEALAEAERMLRAARPA